MFELDDIIDPQTCSADEVLDWIDSRIAAIAATDFTQGVTGSFTEHRLTEEFAHPLGAEASPSWRRFLLATLLADWACYDRPVDRVDYPRLKYIMSSSHRYVRLWTCRLADGQVTPVGYSAWYPIAKFIHDGVLSDHGSVDDRGAFMPLRFVAPEDVRYGYVLNISIVGKLRNTPFSGRMIRAFQREAAQHPDVGLIAVTVDEAGRKFSRIANFDHHGDITVQTEPEGLFVKRPG